MGGAAYYQDETVADRYDTKRFSDQGGQYIRKVEREAYLALLPDDLDGLKVLDVATGTGRLAIDLAEQGADVEAADLSEEMLEQARAKAAERELDITFFQADAKDLPRDDDTYDIVTSQRFLHLVKDQRPYVEEMTRVSRDLVAYDFFNLWSLRILYEKLLPMESYLHHPKKIREMLQDLGLTDIQEERRLFVPYGAMRNKSGPHVSALIAFDRLASRQNMLNSIIYIRGRV
ncbi:MAG: class I SAM-dependent methyltransferase [Candidatus Nanohaloarchaea archaeon]|nr:class I SAM-dependent methyltransferase [Candidatus Nanohaloarchaea archaeon]